MQNMGLISNHIESFICQQMRMNLKLMKFGMIKANNWNYGIISIV